MNDDFAADFLLEPQWGLTIRDAIVVSNRKPLSLATSVLIVLEPDVLPEQAAQILRDAAAELERGIGAGEFDVEPTEAP